MATLQELIPTHRTPLIDANGLMARPWYIFFQELAAKGVCVGPDGLIDLDQIPDIPAAKVIP